MPKQSKSGFKDTDWAEVTDPEERRRIQNRLAQRKFREYTYQSFFFFFSFFPFFSSFFLRVLILAS